MKKLLVFFCLAATCWACSQAAGETNAQGVAQKPADGKKIFDRNCKLCHGVDGKLGLNGAKDLTESVLTLEERLEIIANGKGLMQPFKGLLSEEEIRAVALYTQELANK